MSIEGGARVGYVNPDETTFAFLRGRPFAPAGDAFDRAVAWWRQHGVRSACAATTTACASTPAAIEPTVTWGINPGPVGRRQRADRRRRRTTKRSRSWASSRARASRGTKIDVAFIGSCTNGRLSDLEAAARRRPRPPRRAARARRWSCPDRRRSARAAEARGLHEVFIEAGFEWRGAGCSMCLGMNPDRSKGRQVCASSSNRNFKGRQGSPTGRTLLMSPAMVAAAAIAGEVVDVRDDARSGCRHERRDATPTRHADQHQRVERPRPAAARRRHRHRSDHAGAVPRVGVVRGARAASLRGRSRRQSGASVQRSALRRALRSWSSTPTSAADRRASTRRRASRARASGPSSANRSRRSSRATRRCSACRASSRATPSRSAADARSKARPTTSRRSTSQTGAITRGRRCRFTATLPAALRDAFLSGQWNPTAMLLDRFDEVRAVADRLPYIRGF